MWIHRCIILWCVLLMNKWIVVAFFWQTILNDACNEEWPVRQTASKHKRNQLLNMAKMLIIAPNINMSYVQNARSMSHCNWSEKRRYFCATWRILFFAIHQNVFNFFWWISKSIWYSIDTQALMNLNDSMVHDAHCYCKMYST